MYTKNAIICCISLLSLATGQHVYAQEKREADQFITYQADPQKQDLQLYWKDDKNEKLKNFLNLKNWLEKRKQKLVFAMNAGMFTTDNSPLGLFIQDRKTRAPLVTKFGQGNFYLKPNGVFFITANKLAGICITEKFSKIGSVQYATQSGPMLVIDGHIHPLFKEGSTNLNIRNGVGILPGNKVVFAMSRQEISLYDFARFFQKMGCKDALYLDGFVSRTYLPEKNWVQTDGSFGVIIGVRVLQK